MIFHIARATGFFWIRKIAQKFRCNGTERLAHHIIQHIQTATMRHANDDFFQAKLATAL